jgi:hypothetical protein
MQHERGIAHAREERPRVAVQLELEEGGSELGVGGVTLCHPTERGDLVAARAGRSALGELCEASAQFAARSRRSSDASHRGGRPVRRSSRRTRSPDEPTERQARRDDGRARERNMVAPRPARVDHRPRTRVDLIDGGRGSSRARARTEPVVADDAMAARVVEIASARVVPLPPRCDTHFAPNTSSGPSPSVA